MDKIIDLRDHYMFTKDRIVLTEEQLHIPGIRMFGRHLQNNATMVSPFNPNGSMMGIEGIISPDGRVLGKMGHSERRDDNLYKNVPGNYDMKIFESGVNYFS